MIYNVTKEDSSKSGIYIIKNSIDDRIYIGSTMNIKRRYTQHLGTLQRSEHQNQYLQNFVNKYGLDILSFQTLELCTPGRLLQCEQSYIDSYDFNKDLFNLTPTAGSTLGLKWSDESRKRLSNSIKSKANTEKRRAVVRADSTLVSKYLRVIAMLDGTRSVREVSRSLDLPYSDVNTILNRRAYTWLIDELVQKFGILHPRKLSRHDYTTRNLSTITPEVLLRMLSLRNDGLSYTAIASAVGIKSGTTVSNHIRKFNETG